MPHSTSSFSSTPRAHIAPSPRDRGNFEPHHVFLNILRKVTAQVKPIPVSLASWIVQKIVVVMQSAYGERGTSLQSALATNERSMERERGANMQYALRTSHDKLSVDQYVTLLDKQLEICMQYPHPFVKRVLNQRLWQLENDFSAYFEEWYALASSVVNTLKKPTMNIEEKYSKRFSKIYAMQCALYNRYHALVTALQNLSTAGTSPRLSTFQEVFGFEVFPKTLPEVFLKAFWGLADIELACQYDIDPFHTIDALLAKQPPLLTYPQNTVFQTMHSYIESMQAYWKEKHYGPRYFHFLSKVAALNTAYYKNLAHRLKMFGGEAVDLQNPVTAFADAWTKLAVCTGFEGEKSTVAEIPKELLQCHTTFSPFMHFKDCAHDFNNRLNNNWIEICTLSKA